MIFFIIYSKVLPLPMNFTLSHIRISVSKLKLSCHIKLQTKFEFLLCLAFAVKDMQFFLMLFSFDCSRL